MLLLGLAPCPLGIALSGSSFRRFDAGCGKSEAEVDSIVGLPAGDRIEEDPLARVGADRFCAELGLANDVTVWGSQVGRVLSVSRG